MIRKKQGSDNAPVPWMVQSLSFASWCISSFSQCMYWKNKMLYDQIWCNSTCWSYFENLVKQSVKIISYPYYAVVSCTVIFFDLSFIALNLYIIHLCLLELIFIWFILLSNSYWPDTWLLRPPVNQTLPLNG